MGGRVRCAALVALALLIGAACDGDGAADAGVADAGDMDSGPVAPIDGSVDARAPDPLSLTAVEPARGPFSGGRRAVLRGTALTDNTTVTFGTTAVDSVMLLDAERLEVVVPPGSVGAVDVTVARGGASDTLAAGYTYDAVAVTPPIGAPEGGTLVAVDVAGVTLGASDSVTFGGSPCTDVVLDSPTRISCRTPAGALGSVEVSVTHAGGTVSAPDAFEYADPRVASGGLHGGPIEGTLDVTVLDVVTRSAVADAVVMIGDDEATALTARTNGDGRVTVAARDLVGPVSLHVGKLCYETTSFLGMNARRVTVLLAPWTTPSCPAVPDPEEEAPATVTGELVWGDPSTGPNAWMNVPAAGVGEERVAYVVAARRLARVANPASAMGGDQPRVTEADTAAAGYTYSVRAPAAGQAVFALGGVESTSTGTFTAYVMGVAGDLALGVGETRGGVDITMDIPLDRQVEVRTTGLPAPARSGPDRFDITLAPRLGEAVLFRDTHARRIGTFANTRFVPEPPLEGALASGSYDLVVAWATGATGGRPVTTRFLRGARPASDGFTVDDFLSIPQPVSPEFGGRLDADRTLRWDGDAVAADVAVLALVASDGNPTWRAIMRGDRRAARIPDLSALGVPDLPTGFLTWELSVARVPGVELDALRYPALRFEQTASHLAADAFAAQR